MSAISLFNILNIITIPFRKIGLWFAKQWKNHRKLCIAIIVICIILLSIFVLTQLANADAFDNQRGNAATHKKASDNVNDTISSISNVVNVIADIGEWPNMLMSAANDNLKTINSGQLTNDFGNLFGTNSQAYEFVKVAKDTVVNFAAYSVLAIIFLVQTVKIANKFEQNGVMPEFKEIIFLFVGLMIFKFIIDNSLDFCNEIYTGFVGLDQQLQNHLSFSDPGSIFPSFAADKGSYITNLFIGIIAFFVSLIAEVVSYFSVFARAIQIYLFTIFAPIPLAMLGADETRQFGVGFIKNYVALCLAGTIMVISILFFPLMVGAIGNNGGNVAEALGICCVFVASLGKAGSWAKEILGS
jgi:hypothetical protein